MWRCQSAAGCRGEGGGASWEEEGVITFPKQIESAGAAPPSVCMSEPLFHETSLAARHRLTMCGLLQLIDFSFSTPLQRCQTMMALVFSPVNLGQKKNPLFGAGISFLSAGRDEEAVGRGSCRELQQLLTQRLTNVFYALFIF